MPLPSRTCAFGASYKAAYYSLSACYLNTFWQPCLPMQRGLAVETWTSDCKPDGKTPVTWLLDVRCSREMPKNLNLKVSYNPMNRTCDTTLLTTITSNNLSLGSAGDNDRMSKRFCSNAVLCVSFTWYMVKTRVIRVRGVEGRNACDQIAFCTSQTFLVEV